ncbi:hypothetical protein [uncultured Hymenobacter sp.]|uniref:hypothetical protein n=1 Tax=uncultured Hymenobacter sp. TaxID=170016 RepID=UPI0035CA18FB
MRYLLLGWLLSGFCLFQQASTQAGADASFVIRKGGTYTGVYRSLDSNVPCIRVETTEPVILENCELTGAGDLIRASGGADLVVRNSRGYGLPPTLDDKPRGRFLEAYKARRLVIEHNYLQQTSGIVVDRWSDDAQTQPTLIVRYNQGLNCDGRWRNNQGSTRSSFLQLNTVQHVPGIEISYNQFINQPNQSAVEDNINFYDSSGTPESPAQVHDNYVQGAYPLPATAKEFHGTGLTTDGNANGTAGTTAAYIEAHHNQFVSTCNAAMNIAAGHDIYFHDNRLVTSGLLPDGSRLNATYAATAVFNYYKLPADAFGQNRVEQNTIGYVKWGTNQPLPNRHDLSTGFCAPCIGTKHLPNPVSLQTERNEWVLWQQKLRRQRLYVGVRP